MSPTSVGDSSASRLCVLPTHYCNERQRVTMATRRETHVGCSSSLSFFPPPLTFSPHSFLHLVRPPPLAPTRPRDPRPPSFSSPSSSSPVAVVHGLIRPFFAGSLALRPLSPWSRKRRCAPRVTSERELSRNGARRERSFAFVEEASVRPFVN